MSWKEEMDIILLHIALNPLGSVHFGRKVGEYQQVGRTESIAAESVMLCLVEEGSASCSMTRSKDDLNLTTAEVYHFAIVKILNLPLVFTQVVLNKGYIACIQVNLWERTYSTHMVAMGMGCHHGDRL